MRTLVLGLLLVTAATPALADEADEIGWVRTKERTRGVLCEGQCWNDPHIHPPWPCTTASYGPRYCAIFCGVSRDDNTPHEYGCTSELKIEKP